MSHDSTWGSGRQSAFPDLFINKRFLSLGAAVSRGILEETTRQRSCTWEWNITEASPGTCTRGFCWCFLNFRLPLSYEWRSPSKLFRHKGKHGQRKLNTGRGHLVPGSVGAYSHPWLSQVSPNCTIISGPSLPLPLTHRIPSAFPSLITSRIVESPKRWIFPEVSSAQWPDKRFQPAIHVFCPSFPDLLAWASALRLFSNLWTKSKSKCLLPFHECSYWRIAFGHSTVLQGPLYYEMSRKYHRALSNEMPRPCLCSCGEEAFLPDIEEMKRYKVRRKPQDLAKVSSMHWKLAVE